MSTPRILLLLGALVFAVAQAPAAEPAPAAAPLRTVVKVHDGDTLRTREDGPVRLAGIDTPETGRLARCPREQDLANLARNHLVARTAGRVRLERAVDDRGRKQPDREKWGRLLRSAYAADGGDIGAELVRMNLAVPYWGRGPRKDWCAVEGLSTAR